MPTKPRALACELLIQCERSRSYANLALDAALKRERLNGADAALCAALVYGVVERRRTLDFQLEPLLRDPLAQLPGEARAALRMGLYQLFYMERIPAHAAIFESVALVKASPKSRRLAALANAVLRKAQARGLILPEGGGDRALSIRYACPEWLVALWRESYPDGYIQLLERSFGDHDTVLRVNTTKTNAEDLAKLLGAQPVDGLPDALKIAGGQITQLPGYEEGLFHVQDAAAQLCCLALGPGPGDTVLDLCAAPGGKSFTCAQIMHDQGRVIAMDLHPNRVRLIEQGAARLGLSCIQALQGDARQAAALYPNKANRVLCDVPCSGLGILRKKPDIREKMRAELDKLPEMQYAILCGGMRCLAPGGILVYATCTLNPAENEAVCERFLAEHPGFHAEPFRTLMPHIDGTDGFFIARFTYD
ncbi:MAG: 16S rRNA (cytosine(967)-C(5))-methyltransferase RsmB [Firmicutes bacterium]|nr:16S rRNA (cytosine(967)-C(5))-methyltransferase RsmB [Bacillota bacterium]